MPGSPSPDPSRLLPGFCPNFAAPLCHSASGCLDLLLFCDAGLGRAALSESHCSLSSKLVGSCIFAPDSASLTLACEKGLSKGLMRSLETSLLSGFRPLHRTEDLVTDSKQREAVTLCAHYLQDSSVKV